MKKITLLLLLMLVLLVNVPILAFGAIDTSGSSYVLMDYTSGQVLLEKNAHDLRFPASTTKIMTALIILKNHDLTESVTIGPDSPYIDGKRIFVAEGEVFTIKELLYALLVESANDAAHALAIFHSGSIEAFAKEMNDEAIALGALNTHFVNPHGLHDENHYSSAYDLGLIAKAAFEIPEFRVFVNTPTYVMAPTNKQSQARPIASMNVLINPYATEKILFNGDLISVYDPEVDGIKTGYTDEARNCLVATASKNGKRVITVVLDANAIPTDPGKNVFADTKNLLAYGLDNYISHTFVYGDNKVITLPVDNAKVKRIDLYAAKTLTLLIKNTYNLTDIREEVTTYDIELPLEAGATLGQATYYVGDQAVGQVDLVTNVAIDEKDLVSTLTTMVVRKDPAGRLDISYYSNLGINLLITFILWRMVMTLIHLRKRKKK